MKKLRKIYCNGKRKGLITSPYSEWRASVISRINKLYGTAFPINLENEQIARFCTEGHYERSLNFVCRNSQKLS